MCQDCVRQQRIWQDRYSERETVWHQRYMDQEEKWKSRFDTEIRKWIRLADSLGVLVVVLLVSFVIACHK